MSNVIHADFGKRDMMTVTIRASSEVLYMDDHVLLVRFRCGVGDEWTTTHFLAHRDTAKVEVIPVHA